MIKINKETSPIRCDICHQSDKFDATLSYCLRCKDVNLHILKQNKPQEVSIRFIIVCMLGVIVLTIISIALPSLIADRKSSNTASAIASIKLFYNVEMEYKTTIGKGHYGTVSELLNNNLIDTTLAEATEVRIKDSMEIQKYSNEIKAKSGYRFELKVYEDKEGNAHFSAIGITVKATGYDRTGYYNFYIDDTGIRVQSQNVISEM